jgi:hypothetical protein
MLLQEYSITKKILLVIVILGTGSGPTVTVTRTKVVGCVVVNCLLLIDGMCGGKLFTLD